MSIVRLVVALILTTAFLPGTLAAQYPSGDSGQYVILSAQYGTADRHVDVTDRLKDLARQDRTFRMGNSTFGVDPDHGYVKSLRIYARGPDGQVRVFEYREGSIVDGAQFRSWGNGDWGHGGWNGQWEVGGNNNNNNNGDAGQYVILNAQYGTPNHHADVTNRLKDLARQDRTFRMGNGTFGIDPDHGRVKYLRIFARGPNGQERMFEYQEGSIVDGAQFSSWANGDWGRGNWDGGWEGHRGPEQQPEMTAAIQYLRQAQQSLQSATADKGGHRIAAMQLINQALGEVQAGIQYDNTH